MRFFVLIFIFLSAVFAQKIPVLDFEVVKKEGDATAPTLLLIGGIQGDEPGGFNATNVFSKYYKILSGNVWVVPVLNRHSMLLNHRGVYDDMNRKFATLSQKDPEYQLIQDIKTLIVNPQVDVVLHLHDGSGFYRPTYINANMNPNRWGSCSIIDQAFLPNSKFPNLDEIVTHTILHINQYLLKPEHKYYKRDTQTAKGDIEMEKALTFFAVRNNKSAFANEASKNLTVEQRVYYHLLAIEGIMQQIGIKYERQFVLNPQTIYRLINDTKLEVKIEEIIGLPLFGLRSELNFFPLPKKDIHHIKVESNSHIVGLSLRANQVFLKYGNKLMTKLNPQYTTFDHSLKMVKIKVDGIKKEVAIGSIIDVKKSFEILEHEGYRANVIGFVAPNANTSKPNEVGIEITLQKCQNKFSIDKNGKIFRAEFYKDKDFSGMLLFRFQ
ncbi:MULTISPECIES: M99 family carboxypeptidase catalytic domain-containing protein [unclassified Helicobacter]|uniref:M99 family carboxypeptidase catalytic domain-containing protein n=1 Tax=unclassified Helicobacter TaxID=2593540 RepID=UPI001F303FDD|nr:MULTISPECIES: M99 family carboxypeptidase catalytic domain-containing protein [unclassified Helicobacter]